MNHEQIAESCRHWAAQMHRAASAVEAESDGSMQVAAVIDGNRAVAETLAQAAEAVAKLERIAAILEPLRALEAAATKAPWSYERHATIYRVNEQGRPVQLVIETGSPDGGDTEPSFQGKDADTDILLAARNALPALLREIQG